MRFTIITPSFGQLEWLEYCVSSIRDQLSSDYSGTGEEPFSVTHLIQDAGSPGIEGFAQRHQAVICKKGGLENLVIEKRPYQLLIFVEKDTGMYDAINRGLSRADGDVLAWLNSDEQYLPGALQCAAAEFRRTPKIDVLVGGAIILGGDGSYLCHRMGLKPTWRSLLGRSLPIQSCSMFFARKLIDRGNMFDPRWRIGGDKEWVLRTLREGYRFEISQAIFGAYFETGENLSADFERNQLEREQLAKLGSRLDRFRGKVEALFERAAVVARFIAKPPDKTYEIYLSGGDGVREKRRITRRTLFWKRSRDIKKSQR